MSDPAPDADAEMRALLATAAAPPLTDPTRFSVDGHPVASGWVIEVLEPFLTDARRQRIADVVARRTYTVATVVEGLVNTGNVSAVMRSAEALGFGAFHVVTGPARLKRSPRTAQGADKWLDVWRWPTASACADHLKRSGYRIVVTHLDAAQPLDAIDFTRKTALVLGNEAEGVSEEMLAAADARVIIPMQGFVESFNISVAGALALYHAYQDRVRRQGFHGDLSPSQRQALLASYYHRSVKHADDVLRRALKHSPDRKPRP